MKKTLIYLFLIGSVFQSFAQRPIPRASGANTVQDARLWALNNLIVPRYPDTTTANIAVNIGIDTCGAIIWTYDINSFWGRACSPHRWVRITSQFPLVDGVYAGGLVAWTGVGLDFSVTAAIYVINGVFYTSPAAIVTLDPSDPVNDRLDAIILDANGANKITGVPSANPQEPSANPQTQLRRAIVSVPAGSLTPNVTQTIIYDQNLGLPSEWTPSTTGTVDFANTNVPYHLSITADLSSLTTSQNITFTYSDTIHSMRYNSIIGYVRLGAVMSEPLNLNMTLMLAGVPVSPLLNFTGAGMIRNVTNQYQVVVFPLPLFGAADIVFDAIRITPTGTGTLPPLKLDWFQLQNGVVPVVTKRDFGVEDNVSYGNRFFNQQGFGFNIFNGKLYIGSTNGALANAPLYLESPNSTTGDIVATSLLLRIISNNTIQIRAKPTSGFVQYDVDAGGYQYEDFYTPGNSPIGRLGLGILEAGVSNEFYMKPSGSFGVGFVPTYLTLYDSLKLRGQRNVATPDSLVTITGGVVTRTAFSVLPTGNTNTNAGVGYRLAIIGGNSIKTLGSGYSLSWDSTTTSDVITLTIDTTLMATRAFAQSISGGGGITGVTSVAATDGNGFDFTVTNPTTTPTITATTSVSNTQLMYSTSGAITGSANLIWTNATNRLGIGATSAAYLSLAPSTTSQASLNLGNAGTAPTAPQNADVWVAGNHILARLGGVTYQIDQQATAGVSSITGTANQVIASAATGPVTLSLPQSIAVTSIVQFGRLTLGGTNATSPLTFLTNTDATAAAGRWYYNTTRLGFAPGGTIKRVVLSNDVAPANGQIPIGNGTDYTISAISAANNTMVITNGAGSITVGLNMTTQTLASGATITWNATNSFNAALTLSNTGATLNITNPVEGGVYTIVITQGTGGSRTITTWPTTTRWPGGTAPILSTGVGAVDIISLTRRGAIYYGAFNTNYQ